MFVGLELKSSQLRHKDHHANWLWNFRWFRPHEGMKGNWPLWMDGKRNTKL